ncbi:MAG: histidine-type phosphatase [Alistipes sp.]|nr:histidine-type phosphatase [Alistipes sp.]
MRRLLSILVALLFVLTAVAQTSVRKDIDEHPELAVTSLSPYGAPYFFKPIAEAPKGYKPFYISHYGRHGSRHEAHKKNVMPVVDLFDRADNMGLLTAKGKEMKAYLHKMADAHENRYGELTRLGFEQHKGIARRMYNRFTPVFYRGAIVESRSSIYGRCALSMAAFNESLKECEPMLETRMSASDADKDKVRPSMAFLKDPRYQGVYIDSEEYWAKQLNKWLEKQDFSHSINSLFTNIEPMLGNYNGSSAYLMIDLYKRLGAMQNLGWYDRTLVDSIFSADERYIVYLYENYRWYCRYATTSVENGYKRFDRIKGVVNDIISHANEAIEGKNSAVANLRFGHDYYLLALLAILNCNEHPSDLDISDVEKLTEKWNAYKVVTMASNVQFVFYRSKKEADILVRILENENDITLPIGSATAPFYKWSDVCDYLQKRVSLISE